jgi:hypothetical protein
MRVTRLNRSGHWGATSGDLAKFGLRCPEIVEVVDELTAVGMLDCLQLLHFHVGSQVRAGLPPCKTNTVQAPQHVELPQGASVWTARSRLLYECQLLCSSAHQTDSITNKTGTAPACRSPTSASSRRRCGRLPSCTRSWWRWGRPWAPWTSAVRADLESTRLLQRIAYTAFIESSARMQTAEVFHKLADVAPRQKGFDCAIGGLAVDYEGSGTDSAASLNYSMQSYANDIVAALQVHIDVHYRACSVHDSPTRYMRGQHVSENTWSPGACDAPQVQAVQIPRVTGGAGCVHGEGHPSALHRERERPCPCIPPRCHGLRRPKQVGRQAKPIQHYRVI